MNRATVQQLRYEKLGIINLSCKELILPASLFLKSCKSRKLLAAIDFGKVKVDRFVINPSFG